MVIRPVAKNHLSQETAKSSGHFTQVSLYILHKFVSHLTFGSSRQKSLINVAACCRFKQKIHIDYQNRYIDQLLICIYC